MTLNPQEYVQARRRALVRPENRTPEQIRSSLMQSIGGLQEWERPDLEPRITETRSLPGCRAERVEITTRPGLTAFGWFLTPSSQKPNQPRPGILYLPGHGSGVASDLGMEPDGSQLAPGDKSGYHNLFPLQLIGWGYPVFALEQIGFGERRTPRAISDGPQATSCHEDMGASLMLGETVIGWRVWDAMRALDYMETRPEIESSRMAAAGISGGGLTSLFTGALDTRVKVVIVSGYLNTFEDSVLSLYHCIDNYAPGLLHVAEMKDIAALIAPRALWCENGIQDDIFPIDAFRKTTASLKTVWEKAAHPERFEAHSFPGGHQWNGAPLPDFLKAHL